MATLFQHPFTAADTTLWTAAAVGFDKVLGTTSVAGAVGTVFSNKGIAGSVANESIYRSQYIDALRDYKAKVTLTWDNAAGVGRAAGVGMRVSSDGTGGYFAVLDSNLGLCRVRLVRRRAGVFYDLGGGWVITSEGAGDLNAGIALELRTQNLADGVHLKVTVGTSVYFDVVDPYVSGISIEDGGTAALYLDGNCTTDDITFDDLIARDFADEATSGTGWQTGIALIINGVYYSESEWRDHGLSPQMARVSYAPGPVASIADLNDVGDPFLVVGDWVKILYNEVALAEGVVQTARQSWPPSGSILYDVIGPRQLAEEALLEDPETGAPFVSFNYDADSEFYDEDRTDFTVGDALAFAYDNATEGDNGLRAARAAPASGDAYVLAELAALDAKIPNLTLSGTVLQVEETLLAFMPEYAIYVDPATRIRHVHKRSTAATSTLKTSEGHRLPDLVRDTSKNYTRLVIYGTAPETEEETYLFDRDNPAASTMDPFWYEGLNGTWSHEKAKTSKNAFTVLSSGIEPGADPDNPNFLYIVVDPASTDSMDKNEWAGTMLVFYDGPDAGSTYTVRANSVGGKVWLKAFAWVSGSPNPGDTGSLSSVYDPAYKRNGHDAAFKEFALPGAVASGACATALVKNTVGSKTYAVKVKTKTFQIANDDGSMTSGVRLDMPAIGLINRLGTLCGETGGGGAISADQVEVTIETVKTPVAVPKIIVPTSGYRGTAYSFDTARWNGGGEPTIGDPHCKRTLPLNFPDFQNVGLQGAEYTKMADAMLAVYGSLAISGTFVLNEGLDTAWVGLAKRLRFVDDGDDGTDTKTTGYEGSDDLWLMQAEYNLVEETTTLYVGTLASQGIDLDAYRKRYAERTRLDQLRRQRKLMQDLRDCLQNAFQGAGAAGDTGGATMAGCNVSSDIPGVSVTERFSSSCEIAMTWIDIIDDLLWIQKGLDFSVSPTGELLNHDAMKAAIDNAMTHGFKGVEGAVQAAVMGNKAALEGLVFKGFVWRGTSCYPSFEDASGTTVYIDPVTGAFFRGFDANGDPDHTTDGVPVFGGPIGGILANLGKTLDKDGNVVEPGTTMPDGGHTYPSPGAPVPVAPGGTASPSLRTQTDAAIKTALGWTPTAQNSVTMPAAHGASVYAPTTAFGYSKTSGTGLAGPSFSGPVGSLAGKCGSSFDGKALPGSGPGALVPPGTVVGADGAYYYPPTEAANDPLVHQLAPGDIAPASSVTIAHVLDRVAGMQALSLSDKGGVIFQGPGFEGNMPAVYWRVDPTDALQRLREVTNTPGAGLNGGDWSWGSIYITRCTRWEYDISPSDLQVDAGGGAGVTVPIANISGFVGGISLPVAAPSAVGAQVTLPRNDIVALPIRVDATVEPVGVGGGNFDVGLRWQMVAEGAVIGAMAPVVGIVNVNSQFCRTARWTLTVAANQRYAEVSVSRPNPGAGGDTSANAMTVRGILLSGFLLE